MGLFIRKSKKIGPFRLNLSKSGLGVSAGITGARVSVGPSGTFVHMGRGGLYYRKKLSSKSKNKKYETEVNLNQVFNIGTEKTIYETSNFDGITDIDSEDFIQALTKNDKKLFLYKWLGILPLVLATAFIFNFNSEKSYEKNLIEKFKISTEGANLRTSPSSKGEIAQVVKKDEAFHIDTIIGSWVSLKNENIQGYVHSSVGNIVQEEVKTPIDLEKSKLPTFPLIGFIPLVIGLFIYDKRRKRVDIYYSMDEDFETLYNNQKQFFREFQGNRNIWQMKTSQRVRNSKYHAGASSLVKRIKVKKTRTNRFIEDEKVPRDASIIDTTWKYVNKRGGPDKRFKSNKQIPICQYSEYHLECKNGINEIIMTSRSGGMDKFSEFVNTIGDYQLKFEMNNGN